MTYKYTIIHLLYNSTTLCNNLQYEKSLCVNRVTSCTRMSNNVVSWCWQIYGTHLYVIYRH